MSENSIKQILIGKTWVLVKRVDYSIDGKVLETITSSDVYWEYEEMEFIDNEHVRWWISDEEVYLSYFINGKKLIIGIAPCIIMRLTNSDLVLETPHDTDIENGECSYSELYYKKK